MCERRDRRWVWVMDMNTVDPVSNWFGIAQRDVRSSDVVWPGHNEVGFEEVPEGQKGRRRWVRLGMTVHMKLVTARIGQQASRWCTAA